MTQSIRAMQQLIKGRDSTSDKVVHTLEAISMARRKSGTRISVEQFLSPTNTVDNITFILETIREKVVSPLQARLLEIQTKIYIREIRLFLKKISAPIPGLKDVVVDKISKLTFDDAEETIVSEASKGLYKEVRELLWIHMFHYTSNVSMVENLMKGIRVRRRKNNALFLKFPWLWSEHPNNISALNTSLYNVQLDLAVSETAILGTQYGIIMGLQASENILSGIRIKSFQWSEIRTLDSGEQVNIETRLNCPLPIVTKPTLFCEMRIPVISRVELLTMDTFTNFLSSRSYWMFIKYLKILNRKCNELNLSLYITYPPAYVSSLGFPLTPENKIFMEPKIFNIENFSQEDRDVVIDQYKKERDITAQIAGPDFNIQHILPVTFGCTVLIGWKPITFTQQEKDFYITPGNMISNPDDPDSKFNKFTGGIGLGSAGNFKFSYIPPTLNLIQILPYIANVESAYLRCQHDFIGCL